MLESKPRACVTKRSRGRPSTFHLVNKNLFLTLKHAAKGSHTLWWRFADQLSCTLVWNRTSLLPPFLPSFIHRLAQWQIARTSFIPRLAQWERMFSGCHSSLGIHLTCEPPKICQLVQLWAETCNNPFPPSQQKLSNFCLGERRRHSQTHPTAVYHEG